MKQAVSPARVLVASDNTADANQILRQLKDCFDSVHLSTDPDRAVADFEQHAPAVLVLAFDRLEKAQRYYLGLYRLGPTVQQQEHRTVILCSKDEVQAVFELCRKEYFDDYVLYWPHSHDGPRLAMSIWIACREMAAMRARAPRPLELFAHARHVDELDRIIGREFADTDAHAAGSSTSLAAAEAAIAGTFDAFADRLRKGASAGWLEVRDTQALAREITQVKDQQIALARRAGAESVESVQAWTRRVKDQIEPALAGTRALADQVREIRPVVMVVEDDALVRHLVGRTLDPLQWDTVFAGDATQALGQLRRMQPDVILMDIRLPGIDGLALTRRLKATPHLAGIPVIMMTGDARRETLMGSVDAGAAAFVVKPFTRESLLAHLGQVLSR
jgi:CheY-like chemotaxis protein